MTQISHDPACTHSCDHPDEPHAPECTHSCGADAIGGPKQGPQPAPPPGWDYQSDEQQRGGLDHWEPSKANENGD